MSFQSSSDELNRQLVELSRAAPEVMRSLRGLVAAATKSSEIDAKTKELMALAIAIATKCDGCILFHLQKAVGHGASRAELVETIGVAIEMGGGPASVYGAKALAAFDELSAAG